MLHPELTANRVVPSNARSMDATPIVFLRRKKLGQKIH
jgi:hypothetical protein